MAIITVAKALALQSTYSNGSTALSASVTDSLADEERNLAIWWEIEERIQTAQKIGGVENLLFRIRKLEHELTFYSLAEKPFYYKDHIPNDTFAEIKQKMQEISSELEVLAEELDDLYENKLMVEVEDKW